MQDLTELPDIAKERIMAFFDVPENKKREKCYLVERKLFDEVRNENNSTREFHSNRKMVGETNQKTSKKGSSKGKNSVRTPSTTSYKNSTSKKATSRDNNSLW